MTSSRARWKGARGSSLPAGAAARSARHRSRPRRRRRCATFRSTAPALPAPVSSAAGRHPRRRGSRRRIRTPWSLTEARALRAALGLLACALAALVYQNCVDNPFVFDDRETVLLNASLITPWDWRAVLAHNAARPVVNLSYALDRAIWGFTSF